MQSNIARQDGHSGAEYRMATTIAIWLGTSLMVLRGNLCGRDLLYVLSAATVSTVAVWWDKE
jgi:hypothetical protein